jgi:hypothetical protein
MTGTLVREDGGKRVRRLAARDLFAVLRSVMAFGLLVGLGLGARSVGAQTGDKSSADVAAATNDVKASSVVKGGAVDKAATVGTCGSGASGVGHGDVEYVMVYKSEQSIVCVDRNFWGSSLNAAAISNFFPYFDAVIVQDKALFPVATPKTQFVFEIMAPNGGASTGCGFPKLGDGGRYCDRVTGDAFINARKDPATGKRVRGFWGYLLTLHESINVFSAMLSPGWPADWWADHRSPFPNAMDAEFMQSIADNDDSLNPATKLTLREAAKLQLERFTDPANRTGEYDSEVVMFVNFLNKYGFKAYADTFRYAIGQDGLQWPRVSKDPNFTGDDNHSKNLSEYVIAYLHLGFGVDTNLTSIFRDAGVGTKDAKIRAYELDSNNVKAIADAHCSIRAAATAGVNVKHELSDLQKGNFQKAIANGGTSESCPSECAFSENKCVAKF